MRSFYLKRFSAAAGIGIMLTIFMLIAQSQAGVPLEAMAGLELYAILSALALSLFALALLLFIYLIRMHFKKEALLRRTEQWGIIALFAYFILLFLTTAHVITGMPMFWIAGNLPPFAGILAVAFGVYNALKYKSKLAIAFISAGIALLLTWYILWFVGIMVTGG